jgi:monoamine oxidase
LSTGRRFATRSSCQNASPKLTSDLDGANRRYQRIPKVGLFALDTTMTTLFCVDPDEVSLLGSLVLARGGGGFEYYVDPTITETHLVDGGAPELAVRLAAKLSDALHLSSPVRSIKQSDAGVEVFSDRLTVDTKRVIVATPPLLASRIEYDPALPQAQSQLLRRMLSGSALRGITIYDEPFWRSDGLSGMSVAPDLPVPVALDQSPRSGNPGILSSYMFGPQAVRLQRLMPPTDATFGWVRWRRGTDPRRYRRGRIWKPIGPPSNGRLAA